MNEPTESSILSIALWTKNPPINNITSILYLDKSNSIVTGSECGHIIIWSAKIFDSIMVPINYMISHKSKIISLCLAGSRKHTNNDYFISFSKDREIGLWEATNARSIEFRTYSTLEIQSIFSCESANVQQRLLFCCLKSPEIVIMNSMSLTEMCTLVCTSSLNMFSVVTSFNIPPKDDMILASTESGSTSMWILNFADVNVQPQFNPRYKASKSIKVEVSNPITISQNLFHTHIVMIMSACKFVIYYVKNWEILCYQNSHRGDYFISGEFISINSVLVHCKSGKSLCFKLPPRSDFGDPQFGLKSADLCDDIPHLVHQLKEPKKLNMVRHKVTIKITEYGFIIWKGFVDGTICKWDININTVKIEPRIFSLAKSWKKMIRKPSNLANIIEDPDKVGSVSSILYLTDMSLIVLGMHNGSILITSFENSIGGVFRKVPPKKSDFIKLTGHCGAVLCLIHPCSTMKLPSRIISCNNPKVKACLHLLKLTHILWSGGEDFTLRIWNIKSQQCINVFNCHSGPIVSLKLNHLPENSMNMCGFSQGFTAAMFNSVSDNDVNSGEIRQLINTCMNSFLIAISEDDGISIISVMRRKLLLYSIAHDSPVKRLGWLLDSGYVLLETITDTVYVWDLSSGSMDRCETGDVAKALMDNYVVTTRVRSQSSRNLITDSDLLGRHSLSTISLCRCCQWDNQTQGILKFKLIKTGFSDCHVPVLVVDLTYLLDSLDDSVHTSTEFYSLLAEMDCPALQDFRNSDVISNFDSLMMDVTAVNKDMDVKIEIVKIILSQANLLQKTCQLDCAIFKFLDMKSNDISCSHGRTNSKTGAIVFDLKDLFIDSDESMLTIEQILLQLSISNKIVNYSSRSRLESSIGRKISIEADANSVWPRNRAFSNASLSLTDYYSTTKLSRLLLAYQKTILSRNVPMLLQKTKKNNRYSDFDKHLSFCNMETIFNCLIVGILDRCDWINTSSYEILVKVVDELSYQDLQHYLLKTRSILLPDLDHYTVEGARIFSTRIQAYLHKFSDQSFQISDWVWWYSPACIKTDHDKKSLTKIQIKSLLYLALIGTYLQSDDSIISVEDSKPFSKVFSLDNFFLARITCDFLMDLLVTVDLVTVKRSKNRFVSLAMMCLSVGFKVWEHYLNSTILISQLFQLAEASDEDCDDDDSCFIISSVARQSLRCIALARPLAFVIVCHREMIRWHMHPSMDYSTLDSSHSLGLSVKQFQRVKSITDDRISYDSETLKKHCNQAILKKDILYPILEELCNTQSEIVREVLPEVVELLMFDQQKSTSQVIDLQQLLNPVLKFTSVSVHTISGHISVGSSSGSLALFDYKIGKYFTQIAHIKSITYTLFSNDAKHLATYSTEEGMVKIWHISHTGLLHIGSAMYHVKMVLSESVPSIESMIVMTNSNSFSASMSKEKKKKKKHLNKSRSKGERPTSVMCNETGIGLYWDIDNTTLSINVNDRVLRTFQL